MSHADDAGDEDEVQVTFEILEPGVEVAQDTQDRFGIYLLAQQVRQGRVVLVDQDDGVGPVVHLESAHQFLQALGRTDRRDGGKSDDTGFIHGFQADVDAASVPQGVLAAQHFQQVGFQPFRCIGRGAGHVQADDRMEAPILGGIRHDRALEQLRLAQGGRRVVAVQVAGINRHLSLEEGLQGCHQQGLAEAPGTGQEHVRVLECGGILRFVCQEGFEMMGLVDVQTAAAPDPQELGPSPGSGKARGLRWT